MDGSIFVCKIVWIVKSPALSVICPDADLPVCCSFRHGLRRATFLREEGFGFKRKPNLSLPLGEMSRRDREGVGHFPLSVISTNENKQKRADAYTSALSSGGNWWGDISHISKQLQNAAGGGCPFRPQIPCYIMYYYLISFLQKCQSYGRSFPRSINRRVLPSFRIYKERAKYVPPSEMRTATLTNSPST